MIKRRHPQATPAAALVLGLVAVLAACTPPALRGNPGSRVEVTIIVENTGGNPGLDEPLRMRVAAPPESYLYVFNERPDGRVEAITPPSAPLRAGPEALAIAVPVGPAGGNTVYVVASIAPLNLAATPALLPDVEALGRAINSGAAGVSRTEWNVASVSYQRGRTSALAADGAPAP